jgi:hypothetical protein
VTSCLIVERASRHKGAYQIYRDKLLVRNLECVRPCLFASQPVMLSRHIHRCLHSSANGTTWCKHQES